MIFFYELLLFFVILFYLPFFWLHAAFKGKKIPSLFQRLGFFPPDSANRKTIWIHAVSVGEVKAAQVLAGQLQREHPDHFLVLTTSTMTALDMTRSIKEIHAARILPLDFRILYKHFCKSLNLKQLIFVEGDIWPALLSYAKHAGAKVTIVSGKISQKSASLWGASAVIKRLVFSHFDEIFAQNEEQQMRFSSLANPSIVHIGENLKFHAAAKCVDLNELKRLWGAGSWLTIASTHESEEELLLEALQPLFNSVRIFLAPRHPNRAASIAAILEKKGIVFCRIDMPNPMARLVLVDRMGELAKCYAMSKIAIVGGSFISNVGGHNVLEPTLYGCRALFGPFMHGQKDLANYVLSKGIGEQIQLEWLCKKIKEAYIIPK